MKKPLKKDSTGSKTKLSIVILNHNTSKLLSECLASIPTALTHEIIVVDNASTDDSVAMLKKQFPTVKVIENSDNVGYTRGNNAAKDYALGKYVLFLNSDTTVEKNTLSVMTEFMEEHPDCGASTCLTLLPTGKLYYACHRGFPTPWNSLCYFSGLAKLFPWSKFFAGYTATYLPLTTVHEIDACSGTFLLIRKTLLDEIGWFDEDYFAYGEDIEMCFQVKARGFKVMFNPHVKITHYWGATSGLKSTSAHLAVANAEIKKKWNRARYQAMKIFYDKHYRKNYPEFVRWLIFLGIRATMYLRQGQD